MRKLVHFCGENGEQFADKLLEYENVDKDMLMCFFDVSMPCMSNYAYGTRILFHNFSKVVTESEEAFAYLVFENNFKRWIYQAEATRRDGMEPNDDDSTASIPDVLYQKKVKKRKDNVITAGRWTDEGLERYNNLMVKVREARQVRGNFEEELKAMYVLNEPRDMYLSKQKKRNKDDNKDPSAKKKKVTVMNVLNVAEL